MNDSITFQLSNFKLPPRYKDIEWDILTEVSAEQKQFAKNYVEAFPNNEKESIYLFSESSGVGKTAYAVCLAKDLIRAGKLNKPPMFFSFRILMEQMRQDKNILDNPVFRAALNCSFAIFDDVGVRKFNDSVADRYILLLEQLWLYKRRAIFTSKLTIHELVNPSGLTSEMVKVMESVASRLVGMCEEYKLNNIEDYRKR